MWGTYVLFEKRDKKAKIALYFPRKSRDDLRHLITSKYNPCEQIIRLLEETPDITADSLKTLKDETPIFNLIVFLSNATKIFTLLHDEGLETISKLLFVNSLIYRGWEYEILTEEEFENKGDIIEI